MKTREIRNLKTSKTKKQIVDEVKALKSKRNVQLSLTDWTQISDVPLANVEEFRAWRQELRDLDINSVQDATKLQEALSRKPQPVMGEYPVPTVEHPVPTVEEKPENPAPTVGIEIDMSDSPWAMDANEFIVNLDEELSCSTREDAEETLLRLLVEEKDRELSGADSSSYPMFRLLQEELIEHDLNSSPPKFLERYMTSIGLNPNATEDLKEVEEICKNFFSKVNNIFFLFEQKIRSVYTMSDEDLTKELDERGYRYRPTD